MSPEIVNPVIAAGIIAAVGFLWRISHQITTLTNHIDGHEKRIGALEKWREAKEAP